MTPCDPASSGFFYGKPKGEERVLGYEGKMCCDMSCCRFSTCGVTCDAAGFLPTSIVVRVISLYCLAGWKG
jgi:hypothetical protein